eukprot:1935465-Rhodomonas_salina.1
MYFWKQGGRPWQRPDVGQLILTLPMRSDRIAAHGAHDTGSPSRGWSWPSSPATAAPAPPDRPARTRCSPGRPAATAAARGGTGSSSTAPSRQGLRSALRAGTTSTVSTEPVWICTEPVRNLRIQSQY